MAARPDIESDTGLALALAVVASSTAPLVLLDGELRLVAASTSFFHAFEINPVEALGQTLASLSNGEWDVPQLQALLRATAGGNVQVDTYEMELKGDRTPFRRLMMSVQKLDYGQPGHVRLLLSVADVTDARAAERLKDELLREKAVLLQEVQHRVANSLQIIASVILQSARKVQSEETRTHLTDAHNRVMSVAALQKQLATSRLGEVELRPYFRQLCDSIGASMIRDPKNLVLEVSADDSQVPAETSVSLGLVVTELVINCLKHGFPPGRGGRIVVGYLTEGRDWVLSVSDDGVGMPKDPEAVTAGLGSGIVKALAKQLKAEVRTADAGPGTIVSLIHRDAALVDRSPEAVKAEAAV